MEREMATRSNILAWEIPWTEDPGRLQSMGSQRVGHDLVTEQHNNKNGLNKAYCTFANRQLLLDKEVELIRTQELYILKTSTHLRIFDCIPPSTSKKEHSN